MLGTNCARDSLARERILVYNDGRRSEWKRSTGFDKVSELANSRSTPTVHHGSSLIILGDASYSNDVMDASGEGGDTDLVRLFTYDEPWEWELDVIHLSDPFLFGL